MPPTPAARPALTDATAPAEDAVVFAGRPLLATHDEWYKEIDAEDLKGVLAFVAEDVGIEGEGGRFVPFVTRKTLMTVRRTETFTTARAGQREFRVSLYYGSHPVARENHPLGEVEIVGLSPGEAGQSRIEVSIEVGWRAPEPMQGKVTVTAKDAASGRSLKLRRVGPAGG